MQRVATYEFPLNERLRVFMRMENCFAQIEHFSARSNIWDSQASLLIMLETLNLMERHDIKNELTKELERNIALLNNWLDAPSINDEKLQHTLQELNQSLAALQNLNGRGATILREDDLLSTIRQRVSINSGINNFELPSYYYWLNQDETTRQQQLDQWLNNSIPVANAISLILDLIRNSSEFDSQTATGGFFQKAFNAQQAFQLLRIELPFASKCFPETSGNKHRVSIRFLTYENTKQRPMPVTDDVPFYISYCGI